MENHTHHYHHRNYSTIVPSYTFDDFYPVLTQSYLIIAAGYLVARFQLLSAADRRGTNAFVSYIGMPGIICITLSDADFSHIRWELIMSLFLGKLFVFILVALLATWVTGNLGIAGVLAIFCVHCNDLPVGNPLMSTIYKNYRPKMISYLFFMPVLTLVVFVPLGQLLIEIYRTQQIQRKENQKTNLPPKLVISRKELMGAFQMLLKAIPVVIATGMGILFNYVLQPHMTKVLHQPLTVIAQTVPGMVLSILGFSFVCKERYLLTSAVVLASLLLVVKMFLTPIILHSITRLLTGGGESEKMLSDFSLMYGIVSPATAIFLSGQEFRKPLAAMSAALIITSVLSFPTSFVVAKFTLVPNVPLNEYIPELETVMFWIACISIICDLFVWLSILRRKRLVKYPSCYMSCLLLTQALTSCGIIIWNINVHKHWMVYFKIVLYYGGEIGGYIWAGTAAVVFVSSNSLAQRKNGFLIVILITFSVSFMATALMCILVSHHSIKKVYFIGHPINSFEYFQLTAVTVILAISFTIVFVCLLVHLKKSPQNRVNGISKKCEFDNPVFYLEVDEVAVVQYKKKRHSLFSLPDKDEEDFYYKEIANKCENVTLPQTNSESSFRFFSLILLLMLTMFVRLVSNIYKVAESDATEVMIPLEFLQAALFSGQGIILFLTFGINARSLSIQSVKWFRKIIYGKEEVLSNISSIEKKTDVISFCNKFYTYYFSRCLHTLVKDRKWKGEVYKRCFWGHQLVDWLIEEGLAQDEVEAEELGHKLFLGGVLSHVTNSHNFHDAPYLYYFIKSEEDSNV